MFIIKKKIKNRDYFYLRETKRIKDKVISKTLAYLGKTREEAEKKMIEYQKPKINKPQTTEKKMEKEEKKELTIEELTVFCKRKGFIYNSGELYGGLAGFWDFGFNGAELKNNIKQSWKKFFVQSRDDMIYIDGAIITHPKTWEASGHTASFSDVSVICKKCKKANKVDKNELDKAKCSYCNGELDKSTARDLNLMFTTQVGPVAETSIKSYLRPETAQLIFTNFKNVAENYRMKLPFGIAQQGKAYRNEIAPRDFIFRSREFEQMEIEYFIMPGEECNYNLPDVSVLIYSAESQEKGKDSEEMKIKSAFEKKIIKKHWHAYWLANCLLWFKSLGCDLKNFRLRQHAKTELAHYSSDCWDLEYNFPFGWKELTGIADRSTYDLSQHEKFSGQDLKLFVEGKGKILPEVVAEPSFGVERALLVVLCEAYKFDSTRQNIVLKFNPKLAPVKAGIFPIVKGEDFEKLARQVYSDLKQDYFVVYDTGGSLGRRYARMDEIGTPFCITIDGDSLKDKAVTIRSRDTTEQIRVKISELKEVMRKLINSEIEFSLAGKKVETRVKEN